MDLEQFERRKRDHLVQALSPRNQASGLSGLDRIRLVHEALPELDFSEVSLATTCLGRALSTPFYVAGMTAGHADAPELNRRLARACAARGWALGVGSQRRELEGGPEIDRWKDLRAEAPGLFLVANIGLSQLIHSDPERVLALSEALGASAVAVHANALQEALQPEGTPQFRGGEAALARLVRASSVPVVLKETGCGFSRASLERAARAGVHAIDVSGLGGTHWGRIEGARSAGVAALAAETFAEWGVSTLDSLLAARGLALEIWASGGIRTGLDAAKAIALGAQRVGFAKPALDAALESQEALERWMETREHELKIALFCTGTGAPAALKQKVGAWTSIGN